MSIVLSENNKKTIMGNYEIEEIKKADGTFGGTICRSAPPQGRPGTLYKVNIELKYDANKDVDKIKSNNGIPH
jgi:hypothetical protein